MDASAFPQTHRDTADETNEQLVPASDRRIPAVKNLYLCMSCDKRFNLPRELLIHTRFHTGNQQLSCDSVTRRLSLCGVCGKTFSKCRPKTLKNHMRVHLERGVYECSKCDEQFTNIRLLGRHEHACTVAVSVKCMKKKTSYGCALPNGRRSSKNKRENRRRVAVATSKANSVKNSPSDTRQAMLLLNRCYSLKLQSTESGTDSFYKNSNNIKNGGRNISVCPSSGSATETEDYDPVQAKSLRTITHPYACAGCEKHFTTIPLLRKHFNRVHMNHEDVVTYPCKICKKVYKSNEDLKLHSRTTHNIERKHECTQCVKRFETLRDLHIHMHIHTSDRRFLCTVCNKRFTQLANLNAHKVIHSDDRPFSCGTCGLKFKRPDAMQRHERLHTDQRPFKCTQCDKQFTRASHLRKHMVFHEEENKFLCLKCDKRFDKQCDMEQHMLDHSREVCFVCVTCNKSFSCEYDLKLHESEHDICMDSLDTKIDTKRDECWDK